jgi:hypothetical protein
MEKDFKEKFEEFITKSPRLVGEPDDVLGDALEVLEFFEQYIEETEPEATDTIGAVKRAHQILSSYE